MNIEIDGNDGVGKSTFIKQLRLIYPNDKILDRGLLSEATLDSEWDRPLKNNETHDIKSIIKLDEKNMLYSFRYLS